MGNLGPLVSRKRRRCRPTWQVDGMGWDGRRGI